MWAVPPASPSRGGWATTGTLDTPNGTYPLLAISSDDQMQQDATVQQSFWGRQGYSPWVARGPQAQKACHKLLQDDQGSWQEAIHSPPASPHTRPHSKQAQQVVIITAPGGWINPNIRTGSTPPASRGSLYSQQYLISSPTTLHDAHQRVRSPPGTAYSPPGTARSAPPGTAHSTTHVAVAERPSSGELEPWSSRPSSRYAQARLAVVLDETAKYAAEHVTVVKHARSKKGVTKTTKNRQGATLGSTGRPLTPTTISDWDLLLEPNRARMMKQLDAVTTLIRVSTPPGALIPPPSPNSAGSPYNSTAMYSSHMADAVKHWPLCSDLHDDNRLMIDFDTDVLPGVAAVLQQQPPVPSLTIPTAAHASLHLQRASSQHSLSTSPRSSGLASPAGSGRGRVGAASFNVGSRPTSSAAAAGAVVQHDLMARSVSQGAPRRQASAKHVAHGADAGREAAAAHAGVPEAWATAGPGSPRHAPGSGADSAPHSQGAANAAHAGVLPHVAAGEHGDHPAPSTAADMMVMPGRGSLRHQGSSVRRAADPDAQPGPSHADSGSMLPRIALAASASMGARSGRPSSRLSMHDQDSSSGGSSAGDGAHHHADVQSAWEQQGSPAGTGQPGSSPRGRRSKAGGIPVEASFAPMVGGEDEEHNDPATPFSAWLPGPQGEGEEHHPAGSPRAMQHGHHAHAAHTEGSHGLQPEASFQVDHTQGDHAGSATHDAMHSMGHGQHMEHGPGSMSQRDPEGEDGLPLDSVVPDLGEELERSASRGLRSGGGSRGAGVHRADSMQRQSSGPALDLDPLTQSNSRPNSGGALARPQSSRVRSGSMGRRLGSAGSSSNSQRPGSSSLQRAAWPPTQLDDSHIPEAYEGDLEGVIQEDMEEGEDGAGQAWGTTVAPGHGPHQYTSHQHHHHHHHHPHHQHHDHHQAGLVETGSGEQGAPGAVLQHNPVQTSGIAYTVVRSVVAPLQTREDVEEERRQEELSEVVGGLRTPASRQAATDASRAAKALNKMTSGASVIGGGMGNSPPSAQGVTMIKTTANLRRTSNPSGTPPQLTARSVPAKVSRVSDASTSGHAIIPPPPPGADYHHKKGVTAVGTVHMQDIWA